MIVNTMYGSQSFQSTSAKIHLFAMMCNGGYDRVFLSKAGKIVGRYTKICASDKDIETNGCWFSSCMEVKEGTVVAVSSSVSRLGRVYAEGVLLVSLRKEAPLITIDVKVFSPNKVARFKKINAFIGRGDILETQELLDFNINYPKGMLSRFFDAEEIDELYTIRNLQEGVPRPEMVLVPTGEGKTKNIRMPKGKRRIIRIT